MPQTIYMPRDPSLFGGNAFNKTVDQGSNFLFNLLSQNVGAGISERLLEKRYELDKKRDKELGPDLPYKIGTVKKFPFGEKDFGFGIFTGTSQQHPNMPPGWDPTGITGKRTSAINLSMPEKIEYDKKKREEATKQQLIVDAQKRDRANKDRIASVNFPNVVEGIVAKRRGDDWQDLDPYIKEEDNFSEMDKIIKETYPDAVYDDRREAWYDLKTKKLIRKYIQRTKLFHREDKKR